ncbi:hypothetical protein [Streptomyces fuscigenes]|uniref:hypothetical protein n=1 Tax=Streptomyces fuscigenes TaxID=1528880 RepID=UPI001F243B49|nr:hypothetical protein [Streptomyces fuscigenes]MCF3960604.1 hypothetical protein [Streptomyces fuscigenes]
MASAGCGTHQARIVTRKGATVAEADVLTEVDWGRELNEFSSARVLINPSGDCCNHLANVRSWLHELQIFRDDKAVWWGPILQPQWSVNGVEIFAADRLAWLDRRVPHESITFGDSDLMDVAAWLIEDGYAPDDPGHSIYTVGRAGVSGGRAYTKDVGQTLDHLRDLAETGLDFTAVGNTIILLPDAYSASVGSLSDGDFPEGLVVAEDGSNLITRWIIAGDEDSGVLVSEGGADAEYGLLERYEEQTSITTAASATAAARSKLLGSVPAPIFLDTQQVTISPEAAVDVASLVPGWSLDIASTATCRTVAQRLKIVGLKVSETGGGEDAPGSESVQVQLAVTGAEVSGA